MDLGSLGREVYKKNHTQKYLGQQQKHQLLCIKSFFRQTATNPSSTPLYKYVQQQQQHERQQ